MLRLTRPSAATLSARCTLSNTPQRTLPTSRTSLAVTAQIARVRFPQQPHSIPGSALPRTRIRHVWSPATGCCLRAVPSFAACELSRSWRSSALGSETNCWRGSGSVVVRRLLRLWWANSSPLGRWIPDRHTRSRVRSPPRVRTRGLGHRAANVGLLRGPVRASVRYRRLSGKREPVARAAALHQIGRAPYRICTVLFRLSPYFPIPYLQL